MIGSHQICLDLRVYNYTKIRTHYYSLLLDHVSGLTHMKTGAKRETSIYE